MRPDGTCIHIFNPDTDYALAAGNKIYSPPAKIVAMRKSMALFPSVFARPADVIMLIDDIPEKSLASSPYFNLFLSKNLKILRLHEFHKFDRILSEIHDPISVRPWGWNHTLLRLLSGAGIPDKFLKSREEIDMIRQLSHRRTSICVRKALARSLPHIHIDRTVELLTVEEGMAYAAENPGAYFKAPWSSAGRGVVNSIELTGKGLKEWMAGCIKRQGSFMGEIGRQRSGDFASEWTCRGGHADFLGLSVFKTSGRGRYLGNINAPQSTLDKMIADMTPLWSQAVIEAQKNAIESIIAPYYDGPLGIDMFATTDGNLNPCVEINLRHTMGHATLWSDTNFPQQ